MTTQIVPSVRTVEHVWMGLTPTLATAQMASLESTVKKLILHVEATLNV